MKNSVAFATIVISFSRYAASYLTPASPKAIDPQPNEYLNWLPDHPGHGQFHSKNSSVTPWKPRPRPHHPPHYSLPSQCSLQDYSQDSSFWLPNFDGAYQGTSPFLVNGTNYTVFRNVKDFGAAGDGITDDTAAFNNAITYGGRVSGGKGPGGTTGQPALIYVPPGTYLISSPIQMFVDTQIIGDATQLPTIKAASNTSDNAVMLSGYDPGQGSTTNFYIGVRNVVLDTTAVPSNNTVYALNWAVSQATDLRNVNFVMAPGSNHVGIEMNGGDSGGGSGTFMGDLSFRGGLMGIQLNNQQYSIKNVTFADVSTAIAIQHCFVVTFQQVKCNNVGTCIDMGAEGVTGSVNVIDSSCNTCGSMVSGSSSVILENIAVENSNFTLYVDETTNLKGGLLGKTYAMGNIYRHNDTQTVSNGTLLTYTGRGSLTDGNGFYFVKQQPQYAGYPPSAFVSVKDVGAKGDGQTDDTQALQAALLANANCKITYFPHGVYVVTDTLYVPPGSRIVGEVWSTITASGSNFSDASNPRPMFQVGKSGEVGLAEMSDMLFTVANVLPGAILVEVNMEGTHQGDVSFHNCHYRIGGAADSLTETACQTESDPCKAAFLVTHLTETSSTYIENAWLWSADHDLDGTYNQQIGTGRGMYIEARAATWLVGTASEHHTLYAYQMNNAQNVFAAMMQVETPYWQPDPRAPAPWTPNATWTDPTFAGCAGNISQCYMQWSLRIIGSETHTLALYGQGFWVYFNGPNYGPCLGLGGACQVNIVDLEQLVPGNSVELYNLNTRGVEYMVTIGGSGGTQVAAQVDNAGSWGGVVAAFLDDE